MSQREMVVAIVYTWYAAFCIPVTVPGDLLLRISPMVPAFGCLESVWGPGDLPQSTGMFIKEVKKPLPTQPLLIPVVVRPFLQVLRLCLWEVRDEGKWSQIWVVTAFSFSQGSSWVALSQMGDGLTEKKANRTITASGFPGLEHSPPSPSDRYTG